MYRKLSLLLLATLGLVVFSPAQTPKKSALDKAAFEAYIRHLFVWDSRITMKISDPKPSTDLPGYLDVSVHASAGQQAQDMKFYVSKDGSKIVQGSVYDATNNPFKRDLDRLKTDQAPGMGTPGAPVVLVEFSDFQCPYCKEEAKMLRENLLSAYPKQVRLYFKTFPLEQIHPWSKTAAIASRCVYRQKAEAFWDYHDYMFEHQSDVTVENVKDKVMEWAKGRKDIDALQLTQCMETKATEADVQRDLDEGRALELTGTPTLFINGRRIGSSIDWPNLRAIIDYEIEYQKTAKDAGEDCGCDLKLDLPGMPGAKTPPLITPKKN
jgi:protein-disulfide isomerase